MDFSSTMLCMTPGQKIALARRYARPALTQAQLAKKLGVDRSALARAESSGQAKHALISAVADLLGVDANWFYDGSESPPPLPQKTQDNFSELTLMELRAGYRALESYPLGSKIALPVVGTLAAGIAYEEAWYEEEGGPTYQEVPAFLVVGDPSRHFLVRVSGRSMEPRIDHADVVMVRREDVVPYDVLAAARRPDGRGYVKAVRRGNPVCLESINPEFEKIEELDGWQIIGAVVAVLKPSGMNRPNIEWDEGRPLRA